MLAIFKFILSCIMFCNSIIIYLLADQLTLNSFMSYIMRCTRVQSVLAIPILKQNNTTYNFIKCNFLIYKLIQIIDIIIHRIRMPRPRGGSGTFACVGRIIISLLSIVPSFFCIPFYESNYLLSEKIF